MSHPRLGHIYVQKAGEVIAICMVIAYCGLNNMQTFENVAKVKETQMPLQRLQHTTTHCNTLQHTATHCNTELLKMFTCESQSRRCLSVW